MQFNSKPFFDMTQVFTTSAEKVMRANLEMWNTVLKAGFETSNAFVKIAEENMNAAATKKS